MSAALSRSSQATQIVRAAQMVGCTWAGEPRVDVVSLGADEHPTSIAQFDWEIGAYATALLRKRDPAFAGDLSNLQTRFEPPATIRFVTDVRCRKSRHRPEGIRTIIVAEIVLPDHAVGRRKCPRTIAATQTPSRQVRHLAPPSHPSPGGLPDESR